MSAFLIQASHMRFSIMTDCCCEILLLREVYIFQQIIFLSWCTCAIKMSDATFHSRGRSPLLFGHDAPASCFPPQICSTYPADLGVPKTASKPTIVGSSKFRSRGRFPVLSYFHKQTNAAICRCSQPLSGFSARCVEDEQMLQAISRANPKSSFMYVVDTRPKLNAMANRAAGKGYENEDHYSNIRFQFVGIENIHVMRNSLQKLVEVCAMKSPTMSDYLTGLENSGWLRHIKAVMDAGVFLAKAVVEEKASVLVHCSDGWDRTAQVCSLAGILLDPYYRTIQGLMVLIEKEWISMGHKFTQRCGHLEGDPKEVSPVFTQFIECLWHLMEQYPCAFEFNERYLIEIHDHVYSCQFGNFIGNCQKERVEMKLVERTYSVWPFLLEKKEQFTNPLYKGILKIGVLRPNTLPFNFKFWCAMYNRFDKGMHPKQSVLDTLLTLTSQKAEEEIKMTDLQKELAAIDETVPNKDHPSPASILDEQSTKVQTTPSSVSLHEAKHMSHMTNGTSEEMDPNAGSANGKGPEEWEGPESSPAVTNGKAIAIEILDTSLKAEAESPRSSPTAVEE